MDIVRNLLVHDIFILSYLESVKILLAGGTIERIWIAITDINNRQSNTTQLMILLRCISYIVSFNDMFRL
jgi:hypothetical protein